MTDPNPSKIRRAAPADDTVLTFIRKTYDILEDRKFPDIIDWNSEGNALIIKKPQEFCKKVLPMYFKHSNLTSFIRQLNMYNFHKRRTQDVDHIYCHDLFQKGKRHLLKEIKRKNNEHFHTLQKTIDTIDSIQNTNESTGTTYENLLLKKLNKEALSRIASQEKKIKDLTVQNQSLWSQIYTQNEREGAIKALLTNLLNQLGISISQLPLLVKSDPSLLTNNKAQEELLMGKLSSREFLDAVRGQVQAQLQNQQTSEHVLPYMNTDDFLRFEEQPQMVQEGFQPPTDLLSMLGMTQTDFDESKRAQNKVMNGSGSAKNWSLEAELLKAIASTDQRFNKPFNNDMDMKNSDVLMKRAPEKPIKQKKPFKFMRLGSIDDPNFGNSMIRFETPSGPMADPSKLDLSNYAEKKRENLGLGYDIDLMNFGTV